MALAWLGIAVQWLHVVLGALWGGGTLFTVLVFWPAMMRRPAADGRALWEAMLPIAGPVMGVSGGLVFLLGIVRGTVFGPVRTTGYLFGSGYGHTFLTAILLTLFVTIYMGRVRAKIPERLWTGEAVNADGARWLRLANAIIGTTLVVIIACMVLMRFGL